MKYVVDSLYSLQQFLIVFPNSSVDEIVESVLIMCRLSLCCRLQVVGVITRINLARYRSEMHKGFLKLEELAISQN